VLEQYLLTFWGTGKMELWNLCTRELSFPELPFPGTFIPETVINVELLFPNYMIIIIYDLNPLCRPVSASEFDCLLDTLDLSKAHLTDC